MSMINILFLAPVTGNGGIQSWTRKFLATFPDESYRLFHVNNSPSPRKSGANAGMISRLWTGMSALFRIRKEVDGVLASERIDLMHTTTSGSIGSLRDIVVAKRCRRKNVPTIMHCRYGCIPEDLQSKGLVGVLVRRAFGLFDQIWVLDSRSYKALAAVDAYKSKVFLIPNSMEITAEKDLAPKTFGRAAFIGNLVPSKGLFEMVEACVNAGIRLDVVGPGEPSIVKQVESIAGDALYKRIFVHGRLPNPEAVKFMRDVDIVGLPTYYPQEAFPISILEAMSLTKMVISTDRAAISDMLTSLDGGRCGIIVPERDPKAIEDAIAWCRDNSAEADEMCRKAYDKVLAKYEMNVVYDLYRDRYRSLVGE